MSDMLEKLLGVERAAAGLVAAAEEEAGHRTAQARLDAQKRHTEMLKARATENDASLSAARARAAAEREARNRDENARLSRLATDQAAFRAKVISIMEASSEKGKSAK